MIKVNHLIIILSVLLVTAALVILSVLWVTAARSTNNTSTNQTTVATTEEEVLNPDELPYFIGFIARTDHHDQEGEYFLYDYSDSYDFSESNFYTDKKIIAGGTTYKFEATYHSSATYNENLLVGSEYNCPNFRAVLEDPDGSIYLSSHGISSCGGGIGAGMVENVKIGSDRHIAELVSLFIHIEDIDHLESYVVVQYNDMNNKLSEKIIDLTAVTEEPYEITIRQDAADFKIIENYIDEENNPYSVRTLYSRSDLVDQQTIDEHVFSIDQGTEYAYTFRYSLEVLE